MKMGVEEEEVAEDVEGGDGADAAVGEIKAGAEGIAEGDGGGLEEEVEKVAAFAEDAARDFRDGEPTSRSGPSVVRWHLSCRRGVKPAIGGIFRHFRG